MNSWVPICWADRIVDSPHFERAQLYALTCSLRLLGPMSRRASDLFYRMLIFFHCGKNSSLEPCHQRGWWKEWEILCFESYGWGNRKPWWNAKIRTIFEGCGREKRPTLFIASWPWCPVQLPHVYTVICSVIHSHPLSSRFFLILFPSWNSQ